MLVLACGKMTCKTVFKNIYKSVFSPLHSSQRHLKGIHLWANSLALQLCKNNSWVQNSRSKMLYWRMFKVNQMIYKIKPFQIWACFLCLTYQAERWIPHIPRQRSLTTVAWVKLRSCPCVWLLASSFYGQTIGIFEVLMHSLSYESTALLLRAAYVIAILWSATYA